MYSWFSLIWQETGITPTVLLCKLMVCMFEKCIITCEVTERTSYHNSYRLKHQESGNSLNIVLPPALYSSNHKMILWRDFSYHRFGSVWFMHMFTDVFQMVPLAGYCLPLLVPRWITSGQIGGCLWGFAIFIEVTHHCGPLHWLPNVTRKKQMVRGHGMFGHWNT